MCRVRKNILTFLNFYRMYVRSSFERIFTDDLTPNFSINIGVVVVIVVDFIDIFGMRQLHGILPYAAGYFFLAVQAVSRMTKLRLIL